MGKMKLGKPATYIIRSFDRFIMLKINFSKAREDREDPQLHYYDENVLFIHKTAQKFSEIYSNSTYKFSLILF